MRLIPAVGLSCPCPKSPGVIRGRAPSAVRCEIFFFGAPGGLCVSFLDGTDPRHAGDPQKIADRWRGRPQAKARALPIRWPTSRITALPHFRLSENPSDRRRAKESQKQNQGRESPCPFLGRPPYANGRVCLRLEYGAKKPAWAVKGLSRHILDRRKDACLRYSTVPVDRAGVFSPFSSYRKPSSHWYTMPSKEGGTLPVHWVLWPLRGSSKAFDSAPLNPWFRLEII